MIDGALQAAAEGLPPWWRFPALTAIQQLFLWFFAVVIIAIAVPLIAWWQRRRGNSTAAARSSCCRPDCSASASCPRPCSDPTRRTSRGWRSSRGRCSPWRSPRSRSRHWPSRVRVAQVAGIVAVERADVRGRPVLHLPQLPVAHPRVDRRRAAAVAGRTRRPAVLVHDSTVAAALERSDRRPRRAERAGRPHRRRPRRSEPHDLQRCRRSTTCSPNWCRPRTSSRWIRAWPTPRARGWPRTSSRPTGSC